MLFAASNHPSSVVIIDKCTTQSAMAFVSEISQLNNKGVACLRKRDFRAATAIFREALALSRKRCQLFSSNRFQKASEHGAMKAYDHIRDKQRFISTSNLNCQRDTEDDCLLGVHSTGFLLVDSVFCPGDMFEDAKCASAAIICNLATSFHLRSLSESGCQKEMERAKRLYSHAHGILSSTISQINGAAGRTSSTGNLAIDSLFLIILNNMAHGELDIFGDHEKSSLLFQKLASFALSTRETAMEDLDSIETTAQIDAVLQNAAIAAIMSRPATAPAA